MILRTALLVLGMTMGYGVAFSQQVPHNYEMGPQVTDCDSLKLEDMSQEIQIKVIEDAKFRLVKNFKLNRKQGFQGAWFYSCNGRDGRITTTQRKSLYISKLQEQISAGSPFSSQFIQTGLSAFGELRNLYKYTKKPAV